MKKIAILAYGSVIDNPGYEIELLTSSRSKCMTPFKVEYARLSKIRGNAPTLVPVENGGSHVEATLIHLVSTCPETGRELTLQDIKDALYRRERHIVGGGATYTENFSNINAVHIRHIENFEGFDYVVYAALLPQEDIVDWTPQKLARQSIVSSTNDEVLLKNMDGLFYINEAVKSGIITPKTEAILESIKNDYLQTKHFIDVRNSITAMHMVREMFSCETTVFQTKLLINSNYGMIPHKTVDGIHALTEKRQNALDRIEEIKSQLKKHFA